MPAKRSAPRTRSSPRRWTWVVALALGALASGCATERRVDDGQVVNGVAGQAQGTAGGVADLSPAETVVLYKGEQLTQDAVARPDHEALISFFHLVKVKEKPAPESSGGCGLGSCFSGGLCTARPCKAPPHLTVQKFAEYDGDIEREVAINIDALPPSQRDRVQVAFHFDVTNTSCGKASRVLLVDALPHGFVPTGVEIEDRSYPSAGLLVASFFPLIIPGIIVLASHHGPLKRFDDIAWDVKAVGGERVLVVATNMATHPLEEDDFFELKVSGFVPVPHGAQP